MLYASDILTTVLWVLAMFVIQLGTLVVVVRAYIVAERRRSEVEKDIPNSQVNE